MAYFVAYGSLDTNDLFDPSTYFNTAIQDIGTQYEFRSHISTESLDVVGLGMNDPDTATVQSISLYTGTGITGPSSEQALSWQATGVNEAYTAIFNATFSPSEFGAALLARADTLQGSGDVDSLFGFNGRDTILGAGGSDVIDGGRGKDTLTGGGGNDQFHFDAALRSGNADHITDFHSGHDQLWLAAGIFTAVAGGVAANNFVIGTQPLDGDDYLIYNPSTGVLSYDADGSGTADAMVAFVTLDHHPALAVNDFVVVA